MIIRPSIIIPLEMGLVKKESLIEVLHANERKIIWTTNHLNRYVQRNYFEIWKEYKSDKTSVSKDTAEALAKAIYPEHEIKFVLTSQAHLNHDKTPEIEGELIELPVRIGRVSREDLGVIINEDDNVEKLRRLFTRMRDSALERLAHMTDKDKIHSMCKNVLFHLEYKSYGSQIGIPSELAIDMLRHYYPDYVIKVVFKDEMKMKRKTA